MFTFLHAVYLFPIKEFVTSFLPYNRIVIHTNLIRVTFQKYYNIYSSTLFPRIPKATQLLASSMTDICSKHNRLSLALEHFHEILKTSFLLMKYNYECIKYHLKMYYETLSQFVACTTILTETICALYRSPGQ